MAIGLEVVLRHLEQSNEAYADRTGNFWRLAFEAANRVVESLYVFIKSEGTVDLRNLRRFKRSIVPANLACMTDNESFSNLRDWVILSDSMRIAKFYRQMFHLYQQNELSRQQRHVKRASYDPLSKKVIVTLSTE